MKNYFICLGLLVSAQALYGRDLFTATGDIINGVGEVAGEPFRILGNDRDRDDNHPNIISAPAYIAEGATEVAAAPFNAIGDEISD